jgi:tRNA dimethylallyltransferase
LQQLDPLAAARIHANDPQRTLRALEVIELTGRPISELHAAGRGDVLPYRVIKLVRAPKDRQLLHRRIQTRFLRMLELGFVEEVERLQSIPGFSPALPSMRAVGYRQMLHYLMGELSWEAMIERGIVATRQLAKRQLTWLRADPNCIWLDEAAGHLAQQATDAILAILAD